jgi:AcrR family transcriptional regulator
LSPEERRQQIVEATLPILLERGMALTTSEIAEACEIAEGTIFRVFPTKHELIMAVVQHSLSPDLAIEKLRKLDRNRPLAEHLRSMIKVLSKQFDQRRTLAIAATGPGLSGGRRFQSMDKDALEELSEAVSDSLAGYASRLAVTPRQAAKLVLAVAVSRGVLRSSPDVMSSDEAVELVLSGIAKAEPAG